MEAGFILCTRRRPRPSAPPRTGGPPPRTARRGRRSMWPMPSGSRLRRAPGAGPRWKAVARFSWKANASAGAKHVFLDKPIANTVSEGRAITEACRRAGVVLALGYQRRRESHFRWIRAQIDAGAFGKLVNAEANISRDRVGKIDLGSWRYTAAGMPGGVMLQIGIHYADVLEYLLGPVKAVSGRFAQ